MNRKKGVNQRQQPAASHAPPTQTIGSELLENEESKCTSFKTLGLCEELISACAEAGWQNPTRIQAATIPVVKEGRDIIGVAQTGSGKTGAIRPSSCKLAAHPIQGSLPFRSCDGPDP
ncbi:putative ATP-dependent RNA helicase [Trypanosoma cruzi]|nr:putative ATP-dependent RNA helicase [Trypanosoma cruzi]